MAANIYDWSSTAANNASADTGLTWAEGQAPDTVNDSARVMMKRVKDFIVDIGGSLSAGGSANALTVTANSGFTAYADGQIVTFRATASNNGAATLNVNGIGTKAIRRITPNGDAALGGGEIKTAGIYDAKYSSALNSSVGGWLLLNPTTQAVPAGTMADFAGTTAPADWLLCYGQAVSRTTYANLFLAIGTTFGIGDGSTTFNLPDARGRVIAGKDDMGGSSANRLTGLSGGVDGDGLGNTGGVETHTLTTAQLASHTHSGTTSASGTHTHNINSANNQNGSAGFGVPNFSAGTGLNKLTDPGGDHTHTFTTDTGTGSGAAHNNVQPTLILNKIIKT